MCEPCVAGDCHLDMGSQVDSVSRSADYLELWLLICDLKPLQWFLSSVDVVGLTELSGYDSAYVGKWLSVSCSGYIF